MTKKPTNYYRMALDRQNNKMKVYNIIHMQPISPVETHISAEIYYYMLDVLGLLFIIKT